MHYQLADIYEALCDANPNAEAISIGDIKLSRKALDDRANKLAHYLRSCGVGKGDRVGVYSYNRSEWIETLLACWKISATAININYRYVSDELRYMWDNADMSVLIYEKSFATLVEGLRKDFKGIRHYIWMEDGTPAATPRDTNYEVALKNQPADRNFSERSDDDLFLIYTGGTTGMPKGVMWRHYDFIHNVIRSNKATESPEYFLKFADKKRPLRSLTISPLMHGGGQFAVIVTLMLGGVASIPVSRSFNPSEILNILESEDIGLLNLIGDAMARPLSEAQLKSPRILNHLFAISSGGAILTEPARTQLKLAFGEQVLITGGIGGSEIGSAATESNEGTTTSGPLFKPNPMMAVLDDKLNIISPGDKSIGFLAMKGYIPIGYFNDTEKTAAVFKTDGNGQRWVLAGDRAQVNEDGSFTLVGRDSQCINSGGEKIYVEEVERAIALHPSVEYCAVVGVPDPKWQQKVVAVVEVSQNKKITLDELQKHCRQHIAGYKIPRALITTTIHKMPNGKVDYQWLKEYAQETMLQLPEVTS